MKTSCSKYPFGCFKNRARIIQEQIDFYMSNLEHHDYCILIYSKYLWGEENKNYHIKMCSIYARAIAKLEKLK